MKKATNLISFLILMMVLVGCSKETVHIDFPFEVGDVENIEMYHYAGAPVSAEKKIVVAKTDKMCIRDRNKEIGSDILAL